MWRDEFQHSCHAQNLIKITQKILIYFKLILNVWTTILDRNQKLMCLTNCETVNHVQLRVLNLCSEDLNFLKKHFKERTLFCNIKNKQQCQKIWNNMLKITTLISSIYTFFEDIKYFISCAKIMRKLLKKSFKKSTRKALKMQTFKKINQKSSEVRVQETKSFFRLYQKNLTDQVQLDILQLWLFSIWNFTDMISECSKKKNKRSASVLKKLNVSTLCVFVILAYNLNFASDEIQKWRFMNSNMKRTHDTMLDAWQSDCFQYDSATFETYQSQIAEIYDTVIKIFDNSITSTFFLNNSEENIEWRCECSFENVYEKCQKFFFWAQYAIQIRLKTKTSFFCLCEFLCFMHFLKNSHLRLHKISQSCFNLRH